jgi:hypothetical protein
VRHLPYVDLDGKCSDRYEIVEVHDALPDNEFKRPHFPPFNCSNAAGMDHSLVGIIDGADKRQDGATSARRLSEHIRDNGFRVDG